MTGGQDLLSATTVAGYLAGRGLVHDGEDVDVEELGGGVSNVVLAVHARSGDMVVKQARPRLRVPEEWLAKQERAVTEAGALRLVADETPGAVPDVLDVDPGAFVVTVRRAPATWGDWKQQLLAGVVDPAVAVELGRLLARWHQLDVSAAPWLDDAEAFDQLRVDPYLRTIARRHPDLAPMVDPLVARLARTRRCLVHGDFSPKNVLVGREGLWVIDFEVAHLGDPVFDVAFLTNHLVLKAIHRPDDLRALAQCAERFWETYLAGVPDGWFGEASYVLSHLGALLVARVDGKSPAEYLGAAGQRAARELGRSLLSDPPSHLDDVWRRWSAVDL